MSEFQVIQYIGTPIALFAFIIAIIARIYSKRLENKIDTIKTAPDSKRASLIDKTIETYNIIPKNDNLTKRQKFELMRTVISERAHRLKILSITTIILSIILSITVTLTSNIYKNKNSKNQINNNYIKKSVDIPSPLPHKKDVLESPSNVESTMQSSTYNNENKVERFPLPHKKDVLESPSNIGSTIQSSTYNNENKVERFMINFSEYDFQSIKLAAGEKNWEDIPNKLHEMRLFWELYPKTEYDPNANWDAIKKKIGLDDINCIYEDEFFCYYMSIRFFNNDFILRAKYLFWGDVFGHWSHQDPTFEIVFVNNYKIDLTITKVGIEIIDADHKLYSAGDGVPSEVPIAGQYSIETPAFFSFEKDFYKELPISAWLSLKTPLFLKPTTVYRYTITLKNYNKSTPNSVLLRFLLFTNVGIAHSYLVYTQN